MLDLEGFKRLVLFEDESLLVINKPAGLPIHGAKKSGAKTSALEWAHEHLASTQPEIMQDSAFERKRESSAAPFKPQFIHRLDKDTSGVLVLAKDPETLRALNRQLKFKKVKKIYLALVKGVLREHGSIRLPLKKTFDRKLWKALMTVDRKEGIYARTDYRLLKKFEHGALKFSLVEAVAVTGRTHQLRAHFAAIWHPIAGDQLYGDAALNRTLSKQLGLQRHFLHAARIEFTHPKTQARLSVEAPLTEDLQSFLNSLTAIP